jgi:uncharacterized protein (DUF302 family)
MHKIIATALLLAIPVTGLFATSEPIAAIPNTSLTQNSRIIYTIKGNVEAAFNTMMDKPIKALGYRLPDPRTRVNDVYKNKYGASTLDALSFMTIVNDQKIKPLLELDPKLAGFNPFSLVIYKHKSKDETVITHLTASVITQILGITDEKVITEYSKLMDELDALIVKTFPTAVTTHDAYAEALVDTMMHYEVEFKRPEDLDDYIDEIQEKIEETFIKKGYIMAGFFDYKQGKGNTLPSYDAFWTFSLCHFPYSYTIFDNEGAMPQAAVFAPCTMYMYIKKGTNTLVLGMPRLSNWNKLFKMNNKKRNDFLQKLDTDIPATFEAIGFKKSK